MRWLFLDCIVQLTSCVLGLAIYFVIVRGWSTNWMISWVMNWAMPQSSPHFARLLPVSWVLAYLPGPCSYLCICCFCLCHDYLDLFLAVPAYNAQLMEPQSFVCCFCCWFRHLFLDSFLFVVVVVSNLDIFSWIHCCCCSF